MTRRIGACCEPRASNGLASSPGNERRGKPPSSTDARPAGPGEAATFGHRAQLQRPCLARTVPIGARHASGGAAVRGDSRRQRISRRFHGLCRQPLSIGPHRRERRQPGICRRQQFGGPGRARRRARLPQQRHRCRPRLARTTSRRDGRRAGTSAGDIAHRLPRSSGNNR